jgi:hypothetical protein
MYAALIKEIRMKFDKTTADANRPIATELALKADAQRELHDPRQIVLRGNLRSA